MNIKEKLIALVLRVTSTESTSNTNNNKLNHVDCFYNSFRSFIQRQILFDVLKPRNIPARLLKTVMNTYTQSKMVIKFTSELSKLAAIINLLAPEFGI
jgi:hypothetical protein